MRITLQPLHTKLRRSSLFIVLSSLLFSFVALAPSAHAATAASWQAGNIIADSVFYNSADMSAAQVQEFLNQMNPNCDTWGTQPSEFGGGTRAQYGASRGYPAPYVCLKNYYENPSTRANNLNGGTIPAGALPAAQLIKNAAQANGISVRALLVTIQKESPGPLITDTWPFPNQYRNAMGYGCPDTAPCDPQYEGFWNQINNAARQFTIYKNNPSSYRHIAGRNNAVLYNPQPVCGSSSVYINSTATAGLYNYTPYQPNQAALNNLYGTGDSCSAYGNRNFWRLFTDWFGSTLGIARDAAIDSASNLGGWLQYGESRTITVKAVNTGNDGWCADGYCTGGQLPTRLVAQNYIPFEYYDSSDPAWVNGAQIKMQTPSVRPGEIGTFTFKIKAPYRPNLSASSRFYVNVSGITFAPNANVWIGANSYPTQMQLVSKALDNPNSTILPNQRVKATITLKNTSNIVWYSDAGRGVNDRPMRLHTPGYTGSPYYDSSDSAWLTPSQIAMKTPVVNPGENGVFEFYVRGPLAAKSSELKLIPVIDGVVALSDIGISYSLSTPAPKLDYAFVSATPPPSTMAPGSVTAQGSVSITLRNTGNTVWKNESAGSYNRVRLMMIFPRYRSSPFYNSTDPAWLAPSQIAMTTPVVNPGENGVFTFSWKAPVQSGNYLEYFSLVMDGYGFFPEYGSAFRTVVNP